MSVAVAGLAAAVALAATGGSGPPAPEPLDQMIEDALGAPPVAGITADVSVEVNLPGVSWLGSIAGLPLASEATGRLWVASDGHLRLDLGSPQGTTEITDDGTTLTLYDAATNIAYELALPALPTAPSAPPSLAEIDAVLAALGRYVQIAGPLPGTIAGEPAYTVTVSPAAAGAQAPSVALGIDAQTGVPLRFAVDLPGSSAPALEVTVTSISYGAVSTDQVDVAPPAGATIVNLELPNLGGLGAGTPATGLAGVAAGVPFGLVAPAQLDGLPRGVVRQIGSGSSAGALISYGTGSQRLGVFEMATSASASGPGRLLGLLPAVSLDGTTAHELVTPLGTLVTFDRGGVSFMLVGSLDQSDAEAAAQALAS